MTPQNPASKDPAAKDPTGKSLAGKDTTRKDPAGKDTTRKDPAGKDLAGKDSSGRSAQGGLGEAPRARGGPRVPRGRAWTRDRIETAALRVARWAVIAFLLLITLFPFYYMVTLSLRTTQELQLDPANLWPDRPTPSTYGDVLKPVADGGQGFVSMLRNSGLVALLTVAVALVMSVLGSYAVSRLRFTGRRAIHLLFLAVYVFPSIVLAIPLFAVLTRMGVRGQLGSLVVVYVAQTVPVSIYMLRNYFATIPRSLEEAAQVDGCSRLQVIWRIILPLAKPSIMATSLYVFMIAWNEYLFALLFLVEDRENWTVSLGLAQLAESIEVPTTVLMAGSVILTVPIVVLFFLTERLLTEGLTSGAEKG